MRNLRSLLLAISMAFPHILMDCSRFQSISVTFNQFQSRFSRFQILSDTRNHFDSFKSQEFYWQLEGALGLSIV